MAIMITGGNGFLGRSIGSALVASGADAIAVDISEPDEDHPIPTLVGDVRDREFLKKAFKDHGISSVVHGGGVSGPHVANDRPAYLYDVNVGGTLNIFEVARELDIGGRIVFLSSSSTYGEAAEKRSIDHPCEETQVLLASEPYGASKVACEALMRSYINQFDVDAVALRVSIVYGPGRQTYCGITRMLREAADHATITLDRDYALPLPWVYVDDVVAAVRAAFAAPKENLVNAGTYAFNVTGLGYPTFAEMAETIAELLPGTTIRKGSEADKYSMNARTMSLEASADLLGWQPNIDIATGIKMLIESL